MLRKCIYNNCCNFYIGNGNSKYCEFCAKLIKKEQDKNYRQRKQKEKTPEDRLVKKNCKYKDCQNEFKTNKNRQKYCFSCIPKAKKDKNQRSKNKNRDKINLKAKEYRERSEVKERRNIWTLKRLKEDLQFKLKFLISGNIKNKLKKINKSKNKKSVLKYLSYGMKELKEHLESLFEPWMNWNNHGMYNVKTWDDNDSSTWTWQLDHIIPHSKFNYTSMEDAEFHLCWALSNLRPYSAKQNLLDSNRR